MKLDPKVLKAAGEAGKRCTPEYEAFIEAVSEAAIRAYFENSQPVGYVSKRAFDDLVDRTTICVAVINPTGSPARVPLFAAPETENPTKENTDGQ